jgi:hypothetical protein
MEEMMFWLSLVVTLLNIVQAVGMQFATVQYAANFTASLLLGALTTCLWFQRRGWLA